MKVDLTKSWSWSQGLLRESLRLDRDVSNDYEKCAERHRIFVEQRSALEAQTFAKIERVTNEFSQRCELTKSYLSKIDPGTAGDSVEQVLAQHLQDFFPQYQVVVKGKISGPDGELSPQIDILIIDKNYDYKDTVIYHHKAVIFAFEVKLTLDRDGISKSIETAKTISQYNATLNDQLFNNRIIYGIIAWSTIDKFHASSVFKYFGNKSKDLPIYNWLDFITVADNFHISVNREIIEDWDNERDRNTYLYLSGEADLWVKNYPFSDPAIEPLGILLQQLKSHCSLIKDTEIAGDKEKYSVFDSFPTDSIYVNAMSLPYEISQKVINDKGLQSQLKIKI